MPHTAPARLPDPPRVVVIGGGLTGMTAARRLAQGGADVVLVEAGERLGGQVLTLDLPRATAPIDVGAEAMHTGAVETELLLDELGLRESMVLARAGESWLWTPSGRRRLPAGVGPAGPTRLRPVLASGVMTLPGLLRAGLEPVAARWRGRRPIGPGQDVSVGDFVAGRFGRQVVDRFVDPLLGGLHSGDVRRLSLRATAPSLVPAAATGRSLMPRPGAQRRGRHGASSPGGGSQRAGGERAGGPGGSAPRPGGPGPMRFLSWPGGLRTVLDALLADVAVDARTGTHVTALSELPTGQPGEPTYRLRLQHGADTEVLDAHGIVLAVPAWAARRLLAPLLPSAADTLAATSVASTATVVLGFPRAAVAGVPACEGNGLLVGSGSGTLLKAVTNLTAKWPQYAAEELFWMRLSAGRAGADLVTPLTDDQLVEHLRRDLRALTGLDAAPAVVHVQRWRRGLPQLTVGHVDRVSAVRAELARRLPAVALAGASYDGIGLAACLGSARAAATAVLDAVMPSPGEPAPGETPATDPAQAPTACPRSDVPPLEPSPTAIPPLTHTAPAEDHR